MAGLRPARLTDSRRLNVARSKEMPAIVPGVSCRAGSSRVRLTTNENTAWRGAFTMSNHFTGLSLGPPLGDQRLDLCDLYAFQSPTDSSRTVLILNANPNADALHPDAIYRLAIDTDGDLVNDIAFSFVFSTPVDGRADGQRVHGPR